MNHHMAPSHGARCASPVVVDFKPPRAMPSGDVRWTAGAPWQAPQHGASMAFHQAKWWFKQQKNGE